MECDRNICAQNEYNNVTCDTCVVTKSQKDLQIGDEIEHETCTGVITMITSDQYCILWEAGDVGIVDKSNDIQATGRHFDEVEKLLDLMSH